MSYSCTIYNNSGFNSCNIPDSPTVLRSAADSYFNVPALDILQERFLGKIKVKATWDEVKDADYLKLSGGSRDWYYSIDQIAMLSKDVVEFSVTPDYFLSIGGVDALKVIDGITERVCPPYDDYASWDSSDPLLTPNEPLQIVGGWSYPTGLSEGTDFTLIECTLDPFKTAILKNCTSYSYTDVGGLQTVSVPKAYGNVFSTRYRISGQEISVSPNTMVFPMVTGGSDEWGHVLYDAFDAIATLRSLGLEQSIIRQVSIPRRFLSPSVLTAQAWDGVENKYYQYWSSVDGINTTFSTESGGGPSLPLMPYQVKNNLLNYSSFTKYGMITTAGNSCEYNPEDLYNPYIAYLGPQITILVDPHMDGKPYYRYSYVNDSDFWRNCLAGCQWKQVPLVFTQASASSINIQKFKNEMAIENTNYLQQQSNLNFDQIRNGINGIGGMISGGAGALASAYTGNIGGAVGGVVNAGTSMLNAGVNMLQTEVNRGFLDARTGLQRKSEFYDLAVATKVVVPTVMFPYSSEALNDLKKNSVYVYRYQYHPNDIARIDKLLTMYGYQIRKKLIQSDFSNRSHFNFVMCSNVSLGGFAKWINDGLAEQLRAGVRVWHERPNTAAYDDNPLND